MRVVNLSAGGDPFIASLVIKLWRERWHDEVDQLYVNYNNHADVPQKVSGEFLSNVSQDKKVNIIYHSRGCGNGIPIKEGVLLAPEDSLILLLEDDGFIFESGEVNRCFQQIESDLVDVVGSPRFSCGVEVGEASKRKYNLDYLGYGDVGCNYWPNFFFCKRKDLLRTDLDFGSHTWQAGEYSKELDHTFKEINHGDTFVWACVQLRAMGLRFGSVPQHHADVYEYESKQKNEMNWHPTQQPFKWIHGGSLSAGWGGYLSGRIPDTSTESAKREIETRVSFWKIASDVVEGFDEFKKEYRKGIENLIVGGQLDRERIQQKYDLYKFLMRV